MGIFPSLRLLAAAVFLNLTLNTARADDLFITAEEIRNDVVIRFEGSIDTAQIFSSPANVTAPAPSYINSMEGVFSFVKEGTLTKRYSNVIDRELTFGTRGLFFATKVSGDVLAIDGKSLVLSPDYVSGSPLYGEMTFTSTTLPGLGLERGLTAFTVQIPLSDNRIHIKLLERAKADLLIGENRSGSRGIRVFDPVTNRPSQTLKYRRKIHETSSVTAYLRLQNIGDVPGNFGLRSFGISSPGMTEKFISDDRNVTASVRSGRFVRNIAGRSPARYFSAEVKYTLVTEGYRAGQLRGGERDHSVRFRMSGNGTVDNVGILIKYSGDKTESRNAFRGIGIQL